MKQKFKKGAASFYIVAISTLILLIIATSFAAIIISEIERTSNDDLSQSAYDSALAGIEDAKVAFSSYEQCKGTAPKQPQMGQPLGCGEIVWLVENPDCYMVGRILGRVGLGEEGEVMVEESGKGVSNNMQQAYTCVKMRTTVKEYYGTLSSSSQIKIIRAKFDNVNADEIAKVKLSWYSDADGTEFSYTNFHDGKVTYPMVAASKTAVPPTIALAMVQTAPNYNFGDFDMTQGGTTNRGIIYMTPASGADEAQKSVDGNYTGVYNGTENHIDTSGMLKSNDKTSTNLPYGVYCPEDSGEGFACSATIELPKPVGGTRNNDTFMFAVFLPYGKPKTDFSLEFYCADGNKCAKQDVATTDEDGNTVIEEESTEQVSLDGVQIAVDSTGRANDLYRRVEARLEAGGDAGSFLALMGPLQLLGNNDGNGADMLKKNFPVTTEWNFNR